MTTAKQFCHIYRLKKWSKLQPSNVSNPAEVQLEFLESLLTVILLFTQGAYKEGSCERKKPFRLHEKEGESIFVFYIMYGYHSVLSICW